uniref:Uncharacterized protein n=1 Tax=Rhipicephalus zambeziensis TaxID=60191 RepID=A0A224Y7D2_9ACAR
MPLELSWLWQCLSEAIQAFFICFEHLLCHILEGIVATYFGTSLTTIIIFFWHTGHMAHKSYSLSAVINYGRPFCCSSVHFYNALYHSSLSASLLPFFHRYSVIFLSPAVKQWLWCSPADPKVVGLIPVAEVAF